jgi:hypothetical protein
MNVAYVRYVSALPHLNRTNATLVMLRWAEINDRLLLNVDIHNRKPPYSLELQERVVVRVVPRWLHNRDDYGTCVWKRAACRKGGSRRDNLLVEWEHTHSVCAGRPHRSRTRVMLIVKCTLLLSKMIRTGRQCRSHRSRDRATFRDGRWGLVRLGQPIASLSWRVGGDSKANEQNGVRWAVAGTTLATKNVLRLDEKKSG